VLGATEGVCCVFCRQVFLYIPGLIAALFQLWAMLLVKIQYYMGFEETETVIERPLLLYTTSKVVFSIKLELVSGYIKLIINILLDLNHSLKRSPKYQIMIILKGIERFLELLLTREVLELAA
jgi:hypothetical protein